MTVRGRSGNTYVIQSMPDGIVPEGIRINSVEATILTPNEDIASALGSGEWSAGPTLHRCDNSITFEFQVRIKDGEEASYQQKFSRICSVLSTNSGKIIAREAHQQVTEVDPRAPLIPHPPDLRVRKMRKHLLLTPIPPTPPNRLPIHKTLVRIPIPILMKDTSKLMYQVSIIPFLELHQFSRANKLSLLCRYIKNIRPFPTVPFPSHSSNLGSCWRSENIHKSTQRNPSLLKSIRTPIADYSSDAAAIRRSSSANRSFTIERAGGPKPSSD